MDLSYRLTKNCTQLYELFEASVRYKEFCDMNMTSYAKYFDWVLDGVDVISPVSDSIF